MKDFGINMELTNDICLNATEVANLKVVFDSFNFDTDKAVEIYQKYNAVGMVTTTVVGFAFGLEVSIDISDYS